ncbi:MAG: methyltransferase domain-containing protein [Lentisphaerae bacterium]|nr:methyltransferase domain-containing protein [Lentisphaerota bacterium]
MVNCFPKISALWKALLREFSHSPRWYADSPDEFERLFRWSQDPWNFEVSSYERGRLHSLLDVARQYPHASILEVGCAEGVFTSELSAIAKQVVAIDVSPTALARAKQRCKDVTFVQSSLQDFRWDSRFDLVVCAETLYYVKDVAQAIQQLSNLGRYCLVSYISREIKNLDSYFLNMPLLKFERFQHSYWIVKRSARIVVWENATPQETPRGGMPLEVMTAASPPPPIG